MTRAQSEFRKALESAYRIELRNRSGGFLTHSYVWFRTVYRHRNKGFRVDLFPSRGHPDLILGESPIYMAPDMERGIDTPRIREHVTVALNLAQLLS